MELWNFFFLEHDGAVELKSSSQGTSDFGSNFVKLAIVQLDYL